MDTAELLFEKQRAFKTLQKEIAELKKKIGNKHFSKCHYCGAPMFGTKKILCQSRVKGFFACPECKPKQLQLHFEFLQRQLVFALKKNDVPSCISIGHTLQYYHNKNPELKALWTHFQ